VRAILSPKYCGELSASCSSDHAVCIEVYKRIPIMRNAKDSVFLCVKIILLYIAKNIPFDYVVGCMQQRQGCL
jgi:hypothetical protein